MNGQMKTFIDRVCPIYTMIRDKEVYFVISAAGGKAVVESTAESFRVYTGCLQNIKDKGVISVTGVWNVGGVNGTQAIQQAYTVGQNA